MKKKQIDTKHMKIPSEWKNILFYLCDGGTSVP